jgi:SEL1 protein
MHSPPAVLTPVCAALYDAQTLLAQLEPTPNAHLDRKVGTIGSLGSKGWGDGLGWGHEGPLSTAFRLLPRLINSLLSPLSWLSRLSPSQTFHDPYAAQSSRGKVKITKARRAKINQLQELLYEAEQAGCGDVHGVRGKMLMVGHDV